MTDDVYGDPDATLSDPYIPEPDDSGGGGGGGGSDDDDDVSYERRRENYAAATGQLDELAKQRAGQGGANTDLSEIDEQDQQQARERQIAQNIQNQQTAQGPSVEEVAQDVGQTLGQVGSAAETAADLVTTGPLDVPSPTSGSQNQPEPEQDTSTLKGPFQGENLSPPEQAANRITRTAKRAAQNPRATAAVVGATTGAPLASRETDAAQTAQDAARAEQRAREQLGLPDPTRQTQATLSGDGLSAQEAGLTLEQARSLNPVGRANAQPTDQPIQASQQSGSLQAPELERNELGNQQIIVPDRVGPLNVPGSVAGIPVAGNTVTNIGNQQARGTDQFVQRGADLLVPNQAPGNRTAEDVLGTAGQVLRVPGYGLAATGEAADVAQFATDPSEGSVTDRAAEIGEQAALLPVSTAQAAARNPAEFAGEAVFSFGTSVVAGRALEAGAGRARTAVANRRSDLGEVEGEAIFQEDVAQSLREGDTSGGNIPPGLRPEPGDRGPADTVERTQRQEIDDDIRQEIPGDEPLGINISPADSAPPQQGFQVFERGKQRPDDPQGGFFLAPAGNPVVAIDEAGVGGPSTSSVLTADPRRFRLPSLGRGDDAVATVTRGEIRREPDSVGNEAVTQDAPEQTLDELAQENPDASVEELAEQSDDYTVNNQGRIVQTTPGDESRFLQSQRGEPAQFVRSEANRSPAEAETVVPGGTIVETTNPNLGFVRVGDDTIRLRGGRLRDPENPDVDITIGSERTSARLGNPFGRDRSTSRRRSRSESDSDAPPRDQPVVPVVPGTPSDGAQPAESQPSPTSGSDGGSPTGPTSGAGGGSGGGFSVPGFGISDGGPGGSDGGPGSGSGPGGGPSFVGFGGGSGGGGGGGSGGGGGGSGGSGGGAGGGGATPGATGTPFTPNTPRRTPLPDFDLDEDEKDREPGLLGAKNPNLTDFFNPLSGERLETDPGRFGNTDNGRFQEL